MIANAWLYNVTEVRADLTAGNSFSLNRPTKDILKRLQEPLLIRGYFSSRTHPLLSPLVPQIRDIIREYEIAGKGKVQAELIDPRENEELGEEAASLYNIRPMSAPIPDRMETSILSIYFDIVVQYGDKFEVLNFQDLIESRVRSEKDIEIELKNPEYDITKTIKKLVYGFKSVESIFDNIEEPAELNLYVSNEALPKQFQEYKDYLLEVISEYREIAGSKLIVKEQDPLKDSKLSEELKKKYGFKPIIASLLDPKPFYFYTTLSSQEEVVQIGIPNEINKEAAKRSLDAAFKRLAPGFLKTVGLYAQETAPQNPMIPSPGGQRQFSELKRKIRENHTLRIVKLEEEQVPAVADILVVTAPKDLSPKAVFAIDQFLMKGGTVVLSTAPYSVSRSPRGLDLANINSGLEDWLKFYGITIEKKMVF